MKIYLYYLCLALCGAALGWLVKPQDAVEQKPKNSTSLVALPAHEPAPTPGRTDEELTAIIRDYTESEEKDDYISTIEESDISEYINRILKRTSASGLPKPERDMLNKLIEQKMNTNRMGAVDWIMSIDSTGNRNYLFKEAFQVWGKEKNEELSGWINENFTELLSMALSIGERPNLLLSEVLEARADHDVMESIALSKKYLRNSDGSVDFPYGIEHNALANGWKSALEYYKDNKKEYKGSKVIISFDYDVPGDFDFQAFSDGWKTYTNTLDLEKYYLHDPPKEIWEAWGKSDPQAAVDFIYANPNAGATYAHVLEGYEKIASPRDYFDLGNQALTIGEPDWDFFSSRSSDWKVAARVKLYLSEEKHRLDEFISWSRETNNLELYNNILFHHNTANDQVRTQLLESINYDQRINYLKDSVKAHNIRYLKSPLEESLLQLGHSQEEVDSITK